MTPAIEFYANETSSSAAWRATPDAAALANRDVNRLYLAHYRDLQTTRRDKIALTDDCTYVVASSCSSGRTTAFSNGRRTHDGPTWPGMLHVAQPGDVIRGILEREAVSYYLHLPVRVWADFYEEHGKARSVTPILKPVHFDTDDQLGALFRTIEVEATGPRPIGGPYLEGLSLSLMALLMKRYSTSSEPAEPFGRFGMTPKQIQRVHEFIQANLDQPISLAQLAALLGFSRMHFAVLFRQATGMRPHEYLTHARVERARLLLSNSSFTIAQIATRVGFSNQSHLTANFKTIVGTTPARWRELKGRRALGGS